MAERRTPTAGSTSGKTASTPPAKKKRGLFAAVRSFISRDNDGADENPEAPPPPMAGEEDHWVALSLEQMLESDPEALLHIVSLSTFRDSIGPVWDRVAEKVLLIAEGTLRQHVGQSAKIRRLGDDMFLLFFPHLSPDAGRKRAFEVSVALGKKLVGAKFQIVGGSGGLGIGLVSVPGGALLGPEGTLDEKALLEAGETAAPVSDKGNVNLSQGEKGDGHPLPSLADGEANTPVYGDNKWQKLEKKPRAKDEIQFVPIEPPRKAKKPEPEWVPISKK